MTEFLERVSRLSSKQLLLLALEQQQRIDALEARARSPIAIVGMACRLPGGADDRSPFGACLKRGATPSAVFPQIGGMRMPISTPTRTLQVRLQFVPAAS